MDGDGVVQRVTRGEVEKREEPGTAVEVEGLSVGTMETIAQTTEIQTAKVQVIVKSGHENFVLTSSILTQEEEDSQRREIESQRR